MSRVRYDSYQWFIVIHCVEFPLKTLFISTAFVNSVCELKTCNTLLPLKYSVVDYMICPPTRGLPVSDPKKCS